jgi:hypothetical protein
MLIYSYEVPKKKNNNNNNNNNEIILQKILAGSIPKYFSYS